jgi:hypothetical protein
LRFKANLDKQVARPYLGEKKKTFTKMWSGPEFKPQYHNKKKKRK